MDSRSVAAAGARCVGTPRPYIPSSDARIWLSPAGGGASTVCCVREDHVPLVHATFMTLNCYNCCFVISVVDLVPSFVHRTLSEFLCSRPHSGRAGRPLVAWQVSPYGWGARLVARLGCESVGRLHLHGCVGPQLYYPLKTSWPHGFLGRGSGSVMGAVFGVARFALNFQILCSWCQFWCMWYLLNLETYF